MNRWKLSSTLLVIFMGQGYAFDEDTSSKRNKEIKELEKNIETYIDDRRTATDPHQKRLLTQVIKDCEFRINDLKQQLLNP